MTVQRVLITILMLLSLVSCETENWALVDPPTGRDSIQVRFINFCNDGIARSMTLEGNVTTTVTADSSASATVFAPSDSSYVNINSVTGETYTVSNRVRFSKQSNEIIIAVPPLPKSFRKQALDTILHLNTNRTLDRVAGYSSLRLVVVAEDSLASYQMRAGCPNGALIGSETSVRQSTAYQQIPSGTFVVSLLRNNTVVGIYKLSLRDMQNYSLIVARRKGTSTVRLLDEFDSGISAMSSPPVVVGAERISFFRSINFSNSALDSVVSSSGVSVATSLAGRQIGSYRQVAACASDLSDTFSLYSGGQLRQSIGTSVGVLSKYTIVCFDSIASSTPISALAIVPPLTTSTPADSVTVRVVNCVRSGESIRVRLGARSDSKGVIHNGEIIALSCAAGSVSAPLRLAPGYAPITVVTSTRDYPELLLGSFVGTLERAKDYVFIVGRNETTKEIELSMVESSEENAKVVLLPKGVFTQVIHARNDRVPVDVSMSGVVSGLNLTFTNSIATVVPQGSFQLTAGPISKTITVDTSRRMTLVLAGNAAAPDLMVIDSVSMNPTKDIARSRYLNASADVAKCRFSIDSVNQNIYADMLSYGVVSVTRNDVNPRRVNFVCSDANTLQEVYRPNYPLTLIAGKAYTVILAGSSASGYALILQQEY